MLRVVTLLISLAVHAAMIAPLLMDSGSDDAGFDVGAGEDAIRIELGLPIEGVASSGDAAETVAAVDALPQEAVAAQQALQAIDSAQPPAPETPVDTTPPPLEDVPSAEALPVSQAEPPPDAVVPTESLPPPEAPPPPDALLTTAPEPELQDLIVAKAEPVQDDPAPPPTATADVPLETPPPDIPEEVEPLKTVEAPPPLETAEPIETVEPIAEPEPLEPLLKPQQIEQAATQAQLAQVPVRELVAAGAKKDASDAKLQRKYFGDLSRHIERFKINPPRKGLGRARLGEVTIKVILNPDGTISDRTVHKTSGDRVIDRTALNTIDKAAPFPPFPEGARQEPVSVLWPFRYTKR